MARDIVYYFDKETHERYELGEIQTNFNQAYSLDGTSDSAKISVFGYVQGTIVPNTIIYHPSTNSWWIVSHDQVDRYANEVGFFYKHSITLNGAIELFGVRDLTDCGFYQNRYTIEEFIYRLLKLSNIEYESEDIIINFLSNLSKDEKVDYIKSYENYTLLNALRDFLDGYNCVPKLSFQSKISGGHTDYIGKMVITIESKMGDISRDIIDLDTNNVFNEVQEKRNIDKNSNGTIVVSNASNVVSTQVKTFPSCGTYRLVGRSYTVEPSQARIDLPSNIFSVNWLKMCWEMSYEFGYDNEVGTIHYSVNVKYQSGNDYFNEQQFQYAMSQIRNNVSNYQQTIEFFNAHKQEILDFMEKASTTTIYNADRYNAYDKNFVVPNNVPDFYYTFIRKTKIATDTYYGRLVLCPKDIQDIIPSPQNGFGTIGWERGNNYIEGFGCISPVSPIDDRTVITSFEYTNLRDSSYDNARTFLFNLFSQTESCYVRVSQITSNILRISNVGFVVNYVPMTDLKVKYDNKNIGRDSKLYNQNGKLNDSVGLSKMLLSHSKEIDSENITKYGSYYGFNNVPKVGTIVVENGEKYVINNVSYEFAQNEQSSDIVDYFLSCEFSLSKEISTKSILVNPNTNVRDYGIPQNYNVSRKQLYRDFYELTWARESNDTNYYLTLDKVVNLTPLYVGYSEHIAIMKIEYEQEFGGDEDYDVDPEDTWYYQLNTTTYILKKAIYEIVDFKDNNIIGYSSLNVSSGFDITKLLTGMQTLANTPVQYTDDNGRFESIKIAFCTIAQTTFIYDKYIEGEQITPTSSLYNYSCFISSKIFNGDNTHNTGTDVYAPFNDTSYSSIPTTKTSMEIDITNEVNATGYSGDASDIVPYNQVLEVDDVVVAITNEEIEKRGDSYFAIIHFASTRGNEFSYSADGIRYFGYKGAKDYNDFMIDEQAYGKDSIEVPVFEYSCQIDDTSDIIVGDNILVNKETNIVYIYPVVSSIKNRISNNNWRNLFMGAYLTVLPNEDSGNIEDRASLNGYDYSGVVAKFVVGTDTIKITLHSGFEYTSSGTITYGTKLNPRTFANWNLNDLIIGRYTIDSNDDVSKLETIGYVSSDLMFVLKNMQNAVITDSDEIEIKINHYQVN